MATDAGRVKSEGANQSSVENQLHSDRSHPSGAAALRGAGPLVDLQLSFNHHPWRVSPGWSVLAGVIAAGAPLLAGEALLKVFAAVLLAELAWGIFFRLGLVKGGSEMVGAGRSYLPYTQPGAPAARLASLFAGRALDGSPRPGWYDLGVGLTLALVLSLLLGKVALILTGCALASGLIAWLLAQRGIVPAFWLALLAVGLPWILGASLAEPGAGIARPESGMVYLSIAAFTILQWGVIHWGATEGRRAWLVWVGQATVLLTTIVIGAPWLIIVIAGFWLAPSLRLAGWKPLPGDARAALRGAVPWWWAGMLATALALRA